MSVTLEEFLGKLTSVKKAGTAAYMARCPAHEDREASLSVGQGTDGRVLVHCHAGCSVADVCGRLGITVADLMPAKTNGSGKLDIVATYDYSNEQGQLLYQVCRLAPKSFRQRKPEGEGWSWRLGDTRRVLYRLPAVVTAVAAGQTVYVVEGEKDVEAIERAGGAATCNSGGAGKWRDEYSAVLRGATVVIVADADEPGAKHADQVAASLKDVASSVHVVRAAEGKDATDHLAAGHGLDDFVELEQKSSTRDDGPFLDWRAFWDTDFEEAEWLYPDVLAKGRGHAIYATHKEGKSLFCLSIAAELACSKEAVVCVYLDYEMTPADLYERLIDMGYGPTIDLSRLRYALLPTLAPLDTEEGGQELDAMLDGVAAEFPGHHIVVFIDTTGRAVTGKENDADTIRAFYNFTGINLKRRGVTWARLDHEGKDATRGQRGSSSKGDDVDVIWRLTKSQAGAVLHRDASRMPWVPERVVFTQQDDPLVYVRSKDDWPEGTGEVANMLDRLKVPHDASTRTAQTALKTIGEGKRRALVNAALRWRKTSHDSGVGTTAGTTGNQSKVVPGTTDEEFAF